MTDALERPTCVVFDVDGVLADVRHRLHHLEHKPKDWDGFFAAMSDDPPLPEGIDLASAQARSGHRIVYLTGRNAAYRQVTEQWFRDHGLPPGQLVMRRNHDRRPARLFKPEALQRIAAELDVRLVVDDDDVVVAVLRAAGWPVRHATWMAETASQQQTLFTAQQTEGRS